MFHDSLRVRVDFGDSSTAFSRADMLLSPHCTVAELLPELVDVFAEALTISHGDADSWEIPSPGSTLDERVPSWRLQLPDGSTAQPELSLIDAGVRQGDRLTIIDNPGPAPRPMITDIADTLSQDAPGIGLADRTIGATTAAITTVPVMWAVAHVATSSQWLSLAVAAALLLVAIGGLRIVLRRSTSPAMLTLLACQTFAAAILCGFVASGVPLSTGSIPSSFSDWRSLCGIAMAVGATSLGMIVLRPATREFHMVSTFSGAFGIACAMGLAGYALLLASFASHTTVAATTVLLTLLLVLFAPSLAILAAGIRVPNIPSAGEPFREPTNSHAAEHHTTPAVLSARAGSLLDGFLSGVTLVSVLSTAVLLLGDGQTSLGTSAHPWALIAVVMLAGVLFIQSRSHARAVSSASLGIGSGALLLLVALSQWLAGEWIFSVMCVIPLLGASVLVAIPDVSISPTTRRVLEIMEALAIAMVFPLLAATAGVPAMIQEMMS
ncbi:type VII secretion integral membrane protein EccD [Corynebacterium sp. H113]|uniref:type VII secretion integral membrane protein EccD n=1 Tax=Corynebacterium sp. H113 TaxID=3133419 RepID=UPI0030AEED35